MQTCIVLSAWLLYHVYDSWAQYPVSLFLASRQGWVTAREKAQEWQRRLREKQRDALVAAVVEFQKAQVFFMLAVQVACLIALKRPGSWEATSWQQFWNNIGILFVLAFAGCFPVLLTQLVLARTGGDATYMTVISTCCVIVSTATWSLSKHIVDDLTLNPKNDKYIGQQQLSLPQCADASPIKYCYTESWFYNTSVWTSKGIAMLVFCIVLQILLILHRTRIVPRKADSGESQRMSCLEWIRIKIYERGFWARYEVAMSNRSSSKWLRFVHNRHVTLHTLGKLLVLITEFFLVSFVCILIDDYTRLLRPSFYNVALDLHSWTLGQVISVSIWVPVLLQYLWLAFGKCCSTILYEFADTYNSWSRRRLRASLAEIISSRPEASEHTRATEHYL